MILEEKMAKLTLVLFILPVISAQVRQLEQYNVSTTTMSVSGFSSGGAMAFQYHVAHSASMIGAGIYAGAPYACSITHNSDDCMYNPTVIDNQLLWDKTAEYAAAGLIDDPSNMANDRLYIFMGTEDTIVDPGVADAGRNYYLNYVPLANIQTLDTMAAQHSYPHEINGPRCEQLDNGGGVYVNDCDYDGAFESLNQIYGDLQRPDWYGSDPPPTGGDYYEFDQTEFFSVGDWWDNIGYMYVPTACVSKRQQCRFHIHYHGCGMGRVFIGDQFVVDNGVREVAELNNIIVIYPQLEGSSGSWNGCWDWWGYSATDYATQNAPQMLTTTRMVNRVAYGQ